MFFAHSAVGLEDSCWQPLQEHLLNVGRLAGQFGAAFGARQLGEVIGQLHDLGKYTTDFQSRLRGGPRVDHATWGARMACERFGPLGTLLAYGIAGHHAGLANGRDGLERSSLQDRLQLTLPTLDRCWQQEIALHDGPLAPPEGFASTRSSGQFQLAFLGRMVFSCLVDADFVDTEAFYQRVENRPFAPRGSDMSLTTLRSRLDQHLDKLILNGRQSRGGPNNEFFPVNKLRAEILSGVRSHAGDPTGVFSLTVPTGGGKTLASLAFALDHAIAHGLRRVIFVIPFTSIVEQTAAVFRDAFGDLGQAAVLEHHSAFVDDMRECRESRDKLKLAMENWDYPIIVTTSVQFFESLYAARPARCRKLHNIAGSVLILDEAQTLPLKLLRPCVAALEELTRNYRTSVVLCTATQPALHRDDFVGGFERAPTELAPDPAALFRQLERVTVRHVGVLDDAALVEALSAREQVLCIVNNRRHARALFDAIAGESGARHLSTLMCAKHRREVLAEIRDDLKVGRPCRLVATSLIEAGVDVDFPIVLRAEAGLDSIAQAAGRCNREGRRRANESEVLIFASDPEWAPPPELTQFAQTTREVLRRHGEQPLSQAAIKAYFTQLYWQKGEAELDAHNLLGMIEAGKLAGLPYEFLATKFRMIESVQLPVIVPFDDTAKQALRELDFAEGCGAIARRLQPYLVQVPRAGYQALLNAGAIQPVQPTRFGEQFMQLISEHLYNKHFGLSLDNPTFREAEQNVL